MTKQTYNNKDIKAYLLGSLSAAEAEQFDELSFTDDDFVDALKSAEKDLVDAYASGELAGPALEKFQAHYLASPLRRKKVDFARAFQDFAGKNGAPQLITAQAEMPVNIEEKTQESPKGFFSALNIFNHFRPLQWGVAFAALAFLIFGGWLFIRNSQLQNQVNEAQVRRQELQQREAELQQRATELQGEIDNQRNTASGKEEELAQLRTELAQLEKTREDEKKKLSEQEQKRLADSQNQSQPAPNPIFATFTLSPGLRGGGQIQTLSIAAKTDFAIMQLELEPNDFDSYRVALQNQSDNRILWQSGLLKAKTNGENKSLSVKLPAKLLKSNTYSLVVSGVKTGGAAEIISNYPFHAVIK